MYETTARGFEMPLGKLDRVDARIKRQIARGATSESLRAARKAKKRAWERLCEPLQKETDAAHAAWLAGTMQCVRNPKVNCPGGDSAECCLNDDADLH